MKKAILFLSFLALSACIRIQTHSDALFDDVPFEEQTPVNNAPTNTTFVPYARTDAVVSPVSEPSYLTQTYTIDDEIYSQPYAQMQSIPYQPSPLEASAGQLVVLQHPKYRDLVQCAAHNLNCIQSYQSYGYAPINRPSHENGFLDSAHLNGYPPPKWTDTTSIPRW